MVMPFKLSGPVGSNVRVKKEDTVRTKKALQRLGFFSPDDDGITPIADDAMIDGIKAFQKEHGLAGDGAMKPGGPTEKLVRVALNEGLAAKRGEETKTRFAFNETPDDVLRDLGVDPEAVTRGRTGFPETSENRPQQQSSSKEKGPETENDTEKNEIERSGELSVAERLRLLEDWEIRPEWRGAKHPMVASILTKMSKVRTMSQRERKALAVEIDKFQKLNRNHISMAGMLKRKMEASQTDPFRFPRVLSDEELTGFLKQAESVRDAGKTVTDSVGQGSSAASILVPKIPKQLSPLFGGIGGFGNVLVTHYGDRVRRYKAEIKRRQGDNLNKK